MHNVSDSVKSFIIVTIVVLFTLLASSKLMKLQIVGDEEIKASHKYDAGAFTFERDVPSTRGEIIDYNGNVIIGNDSRCDIVLQKAFFPDDLQQGNSILLEIYNALLDNKYIFEETLPITFEEPYEFTEEDTARTTELLNLNVYATAENCIDKLISDYQISDKYSAREKRMIAGLRYTMLDREFSYDNDLILATDVSDEMVIQLKELSNICRGVEAVNTAERVKEAGANILVAGTAVLQAVDYKVIIDELKQ